MLTSEQLASLLSLISHEVRGPVGVMRGYLRMIEQQGDNLTDFQRSAVAAGLRAGQRAEDILGQLSALARLERGEGVPALTAVPIGPFLQSVAADLPVPTDPVVTVHVADTPAVSIRADQEMAGLALRGIATAVVRAQAGDANVYLLTQEDPQRPGTVKITIKAMEAASDGQVERPLDLSRGGLGLDLPLAAFIVESHNGRVVERRIGSRLTAMVVWWPVA